MKREILGLLCCPYCKNKFDLKVLEENDGKDPEIKEALLLCQCNLYPVIRGVPRIFKGAYDLFCGVRSSGHRSCPPSVLTGDISDNFNRIGRSFGEEWKMFLPGDNTWGLSPQQRIELFFSETGLRPEDLKNKVILDAGCGNGLLTSAIAAYGANVTGIDISDSVADAYQSLSENGHSKAHFIQSDLCFPPFAEETFDLIYSSGVIHHTPDPKAAFDILCSLTRPSGRVYIWLYRKRAVTLELTVGLFRAVSVHLPLVVLKWICMSAAPLFKLYRMLLSFIKLRKFPDKNLRELSLSLFDTLSPTYAFKYLPEDITGWFKNNGFKNINISNNAIQGFGIYANK